jgi:hypothetical protein
MDFFFPLASGLVALLIPVALIVGIVLVVRRARDIEPVPGIGTTRRLFLYWLAFISLMLAASGLTMLVGSALEQLFETSFGRGGSSDQAAFGLAATIVGFPIWLLLMRAGSKSLATYPGEAGSLGRKFYAYSVLLVSATVVAYTATQTLTGLFEFDDLGASDFAAPLVWAAVWYYHWRTEAIEGQPSLVAVALRKVYVYITAAYGLIMLAAGAAFLLHGMLDSAYTGLFRIDLLIDTKFSDFWNNEVRIATALAIVGGAWWWFHWHRAASGDRTSEIRLAAVYVLGIFGGLVVTVSGISIAVFTTLCGSSTPSPTRLRQIASRASRRPSLSPSRVSPSGYTTVESRSKTPLKTPSALSPANASTATWQPPSASPQSPLACRCSWAASLPSSSTPAPARSLAPSTTPHRPLAR